jgi:hypothetical protein
VCATSQTQRTSKGNVKILIAFRERCTLSEMIRQAAVRRIERAVSRRIRTLLRNHAASCIAKFRTDIRASVETLCMGNRVATC